MFQISRNSSVEIVIDDMKDVPTVDCFLQFRFQHDRPDVIVVDFVQVDPHQFFVGVGFFSKSTSFRCFHQVVEFQDVAELVFDPVIETVA